MIEIPNSTEICTEIDKIHRMVKFTFLAPFFEASAEQKANLPSTLPLKSLALVKSQVDSKPFMRSEVVAKLFKHSKPVASYASIFVNCKKCKYINFVPFNLIGSQQPSQLKIILHDYQTDIGDTQQSMMSEEQQCEENRMKKIESSKNFSLRWLNTAEIISYRPKGQPTDLQKKNI